MNELIEVGLLGKTVGLKGFVKLYNRGDFPNQFKRGVIFFDENGNQFIVKSYNDLNSTILFYGFEDIESAKSLTNRIIYTTIQQTRKNCKLKKDEFFYFDILGCKIIEDNKILGLVDDIDRIGTNHLFSIKTDDNLIKVGLSKNFYIPYVDVYVERIDINDKKIYTKNAFLILENS
jgi:16S rRNA processing protein rimM